MASYLSRELEKVVGDAYRQCRGQAPTNMGVCTAGCCMSPEMEAEMLRLEPRQLPLRHMQDWFSAAAQNPMPNVICRFLLPRVLEGLARQEDMVTVGIEVTLQRFAPVLRGEPTAEAFQKAFLRAVMPSHVSMIDDVLCMFVLAGWAIEGLADQALEMPAEILVDRLWRDWCSWPQAPFVWKTAFWPTGDGGDALYGSRRLRELVEGVVLDEAVPTELAERADAVLDVLHMTYPQR